MSPRKTILRELSRHVEIDGEARPPIRPSTISGFGDRPEKYQAAVNELLQARLVEGHTDEEGRMTISINAHRIRDVERELRPFWERPALWVAVVAILAAFGATLAI